MSDEGKKKDYELRLEGLESDSPQTLQRVKGILIGDMEFSVAEVQGILESYPLVIKRSSDKVSLQVQANSLKEAGAKVLLVKPSEESEEITSNEVEFKLEEMDSGSVSPAASPEPSKDNEKANEIEFEIEMDQATLEILEDDEEEPQNAYELNLDSDPEQSLAELEKELGESLGIQRDSESKKSEESPATDALADPSPKSDDAFSLELGEAAISLELIDSPALANAPEDDGNFEADNLSRSLMEELGAEAKPQPKASGEVTEEKPAAAAPVAPTSSAPAPPKPAPPSLSEIEASFLQLEEENKKELPAVKEAPAVKAAPAVKEEKNEALSAPKDEVKKESEQPARKEIPSSSEIKELETRFEQKAPSPAKPIAKKRGFGQSVISKEMSIFIVVAGALLGAVNWLYFSFFERAPVELAKNSEIFIPDEIEAPKTEVKEELPTALYEKELELPDLSIKFSLNAALDRIASGRIEIIGPKPADLTPEEIVRNVPPRIWLRKAEADSFTFEKTEDGIFEGSAPLKFYFEQGDLRKRIVGVINISAAFSENDLLGAHLSLELNEKPSELNTLLLERTEDGLFAAAFKTRLDLKKVAEPPPSPEKEEPVEEEAAMGEDES